VQKEVGSPAVSPNLWRRGFRSNLNTHDKHLMFVRPPS
jgi:hypothetical protein